jgi:hypothetical protein
MTDPPRHGGAQAGRIASPIPPWENPPSYLAAIRVRGVSLARSNTETLRLKCVPRS